MTECRDFDPSEASVMAQLLADQATDYAVTKYNAYLTSNCYSDHQFIGILIDTSALAILTAGLRQYYAYCYTFGPVALKTDTNNQITVCFRIRSTLSVGSILISTLVSQATFYVMNSDTLFLLCL